MKIMLKRTRDGSFEAVEVGVGTRIMDLREIERDRMPYPVFGAVANHRFVPMDTVLQEGMQVELMDLRSAAALYSYQDALSLMFLTACAEELEGARVEIANSLNQGFYCEIRGLTPVPKETAKAVEARMRRMAEEDLPIRRIYVSPQEAGAILERECNYPGFRLMEQMNPDRKVCLSELNGHHMLTCYGTLPSCGWVKMFELRSYRRGVLLRFPNMENPDCLPPYRDQEKLYQAFGEQTRWERLMKVSYVADLNEKVVGDSFRELVQISEALHEKKVAEIADRIKAEKKRIILIAGPSSSGKTTFAKRLQIQLRVNGLDALYLGTDDYFVERGETPLDENGEPDYEGLAAIDTELFCRNMNDLMAGKAVDLPRFNFLTGRKEFGHRITAIRENQPIIIEGIHGLNEELTGGIAKEEQFRIYISPLTQLNLDCHNRVPTTDERLLRRLVRDYQFRGHDAATTIREWPKVRAGEDRNIFPYSGAADVVYNSYHIYEIAVLKKYAVPLLEAVGPEEPEYAMARQLLAVMDSFRMAGDDSCIVNNSIMREFIGGSVFLD